MSSATQHRDAPRDFYIDRLRSVMTALVILHHTAITYGGSGGWFYRELHPSNTPSSILLTLFLATNQSYFMGFFFLLAGYFTPRSLDRKGYARFIRDRFQRLGIPLVVFILVLGPLTAAIANVADGGPFWATFPSLLQRHVIIPGPLWFAEALLIFSLGYCAWRRLSARPLSEVHPPAKRVPAFVWWLLCALGVAAASFAIRLIVPIGTEILWLQLGYFAPYVLLFILGIAARRYDWFAQLRWRSVTPWLVILLMAWPTLPAAFFASKGAEALSSFNGGMHWQAVFYALWDPLVAWGIMGGYLVLFRERMNRPSRLWDWIDRRAYAVYILHPVILVALACLLRGWAAPALVKFGVVGCSSVILCWLVSDMVVRMPLIRDIV